MPAKIDQIVNICGFLDQPTLDKLRLVLRHAEITAQLLRELASAIRIVWHRPIIIRLSFPVSNPFNRMEWYAEIEVQRGEIRQTENRSQLLRYTVRVPLHDQRSLDKYRKVCQAASQNMGRRRKATRAEDVRV